MNSQRRLASIFAGSALALFASVGETFADQIDGDWCFPTDGRNLTVQGDDIVTSKGMSTKGDYALHAFRYVVPDGYPGVGGEINMRQLNDQTKMFLRPYGTEETWKRCDLQTR